MSTVFHGYKIPLSKWNEVRREIRKFYLAENAIINAVKSTASDGEKQFKIISAFGKEVEVSIQLFQLDTDREHYYFRVLEHSYFFANLMDKTPERFPDIQSFFYDDRSDMEPGEELRLDTVNAIDECVKNKDYLIAPIIDSVDLMQLAVETNAAYFKDKNNDTN